MIKIICVLYLIKKTHFDHFTQIETDFGMYNQSQEYARVISMFGFDPKVKYHKFLLTSTGGNP